MDVTEIDEKIRNAKQNKATIRNCRFFNLLVNGLKTDVSFCWLVNIVYLLIPVSPQFMNI